jgi:hypothetical protein
MFQEDRQQAKHAAVRAAKRPIIVKGAYERIKKQGGSQARSSDCSAKPAALTGHQIRMRAHKQV